MHLKNIGRFLLAVMILSQFSLAQAKTLYRYINKEGKVEFSDKVPPEDSQLEHATLNEKGQVISIRDAAKTPQQISQLRAIKKLQKQKAHILKKQMVKDDLLLRTFQSISAIDDALKSKQNMLDTQVFQTKKQTAALRKQLLTYQKSAAGFEKLSKPIPERTLANLKMAKSQFNNNQLSIKRLNNDKAAITSTFEKDRARFIQLQKHRHSKPSVFTTGIPSLSLGKLTCTMEDCSETWQQAKKFALQYAQTKVSFESAQLLLTKPPGSGNSTSLSLTRLSDEKETTIFLDLYCQNSKKGKSTCKSEATQKTIKQFNKLLD